MDRGGREDWGLHWRKGTHAVTLQLSSVDKGISFGHRWPPSVKVQSLTLRGQCYAVLLSELFL